MACRGGAERIEGCVGNSAAPMQAPPPPPHRPPPGLQRVPSSQPEPAQRRWGPGAAPGAPHPPLVCLLRPAAAPVRAAASPEWPVNKCIWAPAPIEGARLRGAAAHSAARRAHSPPRRALTSSGPGEGGRRQLVRGSEGPSSLPALPRAPAGCRLRAPPAARPLDAGPAWLCTGWTPRALPVYDSPCVQPPWIGVRLPLWPGPSAWLSGAGARANCAWRPLQGPQLECKVRSRGRPAGRSRRPPGAAH